MMDVVAAAGELHMEQMDVTTAFLYAKLEGEVYLEIPMGMFAAEMPRKVLRPLSMLCCFMSFWRLDSYKAGMTNSVSCVTQGLPWP